MSLAHSDAKSGGTHHQVAASLLQASGRTPNENLFLQKAADRMNSVVQFLSDATDEKTKGTIAQTSKKLAEFIERYQTAEVSNDTKAEIVKGFKDEANALLTSMKKCIALVSTALPTADEMEALYKSLAPQKDPNAFVLSNKRQYIDSIGKANAIRNQLNVDYRDELDTFHQYLAVTNDEPVSMMQLILDGLTAIETAQQKASVAAAATAANCCKTL